MMATRKPNWDQGVLDAIQRRDLASLDRLVGGTKNPDRRHATGLSALTLCTIAGWLDGVRLVLKIGADPNGMTCRSCADAWLTELPDGHALFVLFMDQHVRPIMVAALQGHGAIFTELIAQGARPDAVTAFGRTVFACAVEGGNLEIVGYFLQREFRIEVAVDGQPPLLQAAARGGSAKVVAALLQAGADPNAIDADGMTPLALALKLGHEDAALALLRGGATIDAGGKAADAGWPLQLACDHGMARAVAALFEQGADANRPGPSGLYPLIEAARGGHLEVLRSLLQRGAEVDVQSAQTRETALMAAARGGHAEVVALLLDQGADPDRENCLGKTALEGAAGGDHAAVLRLLIERGARIDERRRAALWQEAAVRNAAAVLGYLQQRCPPIDQAHSVTGMTPLLTVVSLGNTDAIRVLLGAGADPRRWSTEGKQAIHLAPNPAALQLLLDAGVGVNEPDRHGDTALHRAVRALDPGCVQWLLHHGAEVHASGRWRQTGLLLACAQGNGHERQSGRCTSDEERKTEAIIQLLSQAGADPNQADAAGTTPLMFALALRSPAAVAHLLQQPGLQLNQASHRGTTALMCAVAGAGDINFLFDSNRGCDLVRVGTPNGTAEEVEFVLQQGAAVNAVNRDGWSPLVFAARTGDRAMVGRLLRAGADRSAVAAAGDRFDTARLIRQAGLDDLLA